MANNSNCCLCKTALDTDTADVLAIGRYGTPRYLCAECSGKIEAATTARDYGEAVAAIEALGEMLVDVGADDTVIKDSLTPIIEQAAERASKIKAGEYDFALDEREEDTDTEIPEELLETEEDRALDEKDAAAQKKFDKYMNIGMLVGLAAAIIIFIITRFL